MKDFLLYFAGYIDGDGHFRFRKYIQDGYECFNCKIMITSTCEEPIKYFIEQIGGSYYAKKKTQADWKQEFIYTLHVGKEVLSKISDLSDYLIEKKSQFDLIKSFLYGSKEERFAIVEKAKNLRNSDLCTIESFKKIKTISDRQVPNRDDFIYLSGFIDSECCLTVTRKILKTGSLSFSCHLRCASTKFPCIEFLFRKFGGCIHFKSSNHENFSDSIQWQLTDKSLEPFLEHIYPYLINKKEQCKEIMRLRETYISRPYPRDKNFHIYNSHFTPIRESIYSKLKELNKRGL